jgi:hypothetical protein
LFKNPFMCSFIANRGHHDYNIDWYIELTSLNIVAASLITLIIKRGVQYRQYI